MEFVLDFLLIQLKGTGIVAVEVKLALKRKVLRDFQIAGSTQCGIMEVDVVLLDRFSAFV
jgi:hypothetical protein